MSYFYIKDLYENRMWNMQLKTSRFCFLSNIFGVSRFLIQLFY